MKQNHLKWLFVAAMLMPALLLCLLPVTVSAATEHITLQLKWKHQFQFAGYYAAIEQGYYKDAGLEVSLREAVFGKNPIHAVIDGEAEYGTGTSDLLLDRAEGAPVVVLGVIFQHSPFVLIAHSNMVKDGIGELRGKRIMLEPNGAEIIAMLQHEGLPRWSYLRVANSFNLEDWFQHKVAAIDAYITDQPFELSRRGTPYHLFKPADFGVDFYGDNFFTTEQELRNHPERVQHFREATLKGWAYAMQHQDEIIRLLRDKYHARHSAEKLRFEANAMQSLLEYRTIPVGYMYEGRWQNIVKTYQQLGLINNDFQLTGFIYQHEPQLFDTLWSWRWQLLVGMLLLLLMIGAGLVFLLRRMVAQRVAELQQAKRLADVSSAEKTRFLASASHDLRQPMQAMSLNIEVLMHRFTQSEGECAEQLAVTEAIRDSHAAMRRVLDSLLDISKLDAGVVEVEVEPIHLGRLIGNLTGDFAQLAEKKGVTLETEMIDVCVCSDLVALECILNNLISNALRYTETGGRILVRCRKQKKRVIVEVCDTGIGIPADQLEYIFQEFIQLNNPERDREKGLGLGLSIVNRLVQLLPNHAIDVKSTPGKGSRFRLTMPEAEDWAAATTEVAALNLMPFEGMRILILEDDNASRKAMVALTQQWGCETKDAGSGDAALAIVHDGWVPDAIIADYRLPCNITGVEVVGKLCALLQQRTPALIVTGETQTETLQSIEDARFPILHKPVTPAKIMLFLRQCQRKHGTTVHR